jgi:Uri superfamily endonuclease
MQTSADKPGTYLLLLECKKQTRLSIGKLGDMTTVPGYYVYIGSAFGPGGVRARVRHHRKTAARPHWHIDHLRTTAELLEVYCVYDIRYEHEWALALMQNDAAILPLTGFGSSDCNCATHLFYFRRRPQKTELEKLLNIKLEIITACS